MTDTKRAKDMTSEEQIERLVRQRNELWKLTYRFALDHGDDESGDGLRSEDRYNPFEVTVEEESDELFVRMPNPMLKIRELRLAATKLADTCDDIVGNMYAVEGVNPMHGELEDESRDIGPYGRVASETGPW